MAARGQRNRVTAPELEQFVVVDVQLTGVSLGAGAYGSVEEVEIPGARVAAKKLHTQLINLGSPQQVQRWVTNFVEECKLMSQLRHPHIVQFLGVAYLPGSPIPVLLMEKLQTSLDNLLETSPNIPLDVKVHLLTGTAQGVVYLHSHTPPIAHRDLTARNILIDSGLAAKIADLGVARMVNIQPGQLAATMTAGPGNNLYMPPETVQEEGATRYNTAIDIFSFGVVSLFTLTQTFPKDLKPHNYLDPRTRRIVGRSEIERREHYIQLMQVALGETHPLVKLTLDCLEYLPEDRPSAMEVLRRLKEVGRTVPQNCTETKLELIQQITTKNALTASREEEIRQIRAYHQRQLSEKDTLIAQLQTEKQYHRREIERLSSPLELQPQEEGATQPLYRAKAITFNWRKCSNRPSHVEVNDQPVHHNGKLYVRGESRGATSVLEYTPDDHQWAELPSPPVDYFTIATLRGQLLIVGGKDMPIFKKTKTILTFDEHSQRWIQSYPAMPTALTLPAVAVYQDHLIVAGEESTDVNILDATNSKWKKAQSLDSYRESFKTALIEDTLYLVGWNTQTVLRAHMPTLISGAKSGVWETLPNSPYYYSAPVIIGHTLLTLGGDKNELAEHPTTSIQMYNPTINQWTKVGDLPEVVGISFCTVHSGKLLVLSDSIHVYVSELRVEY